MKNILWGILIGAFLLIAGCSENPIIPSETQIVVQAYLYAGEPVTEVYVGRSNSVGSADSSNQPATNAIVTLKKNTLSYPLTADLTRNGFYFYNGTTLTVATGDLFSIEVVLDGIIVTGETVVPAKPSSVSISKDTIVFATETVTTPRGTMTRITMTDTVNIRWSNPAGDLYFVMVKSVDSARMPLAVDSARMPGRFFISRPTAQNFHFLNPGQISYTGKYIAYLYRINKEYADLYKSREQDSRNLTEPLTNIRNGLGVFSAFAGETVGFSVRKQ